MGGQISRRAYFVHACRLDAQNSWRRPLRLLPACHGRNKFSPGRTRPKSISQVSANSVVPPRREWELERRMRSRNLKSPCIVSGSVAVLGYITLTIKVTVRFYSPQCREIACAASASTPNAKHPCALTDRRLRSSKLVFPSSAHPIHRTMAPLEVSTRHATAASMWFRGSGSFELSEFHEP